MRVRDLKERKASLSTARPQRGVEVMKYETEIELNPQISIKKGL
jgi:hypothetical protein